MKLKEEISLAMRRALAGLAAVLWLILTCAAAETGKAGQFEAELQICAEPVSEAPNAARRAEMGDEVSVYIMFQNPSVDKEGNSGVLLDSVIRRPDGSIVCEHRNLTGWAAMKPAPQEESIEADCHLEIEPEEDDVPGKYTVEVTVKDVPGKVQVVLTGAVEFVAKGAKEAGSK